MVALIRSNPHLARFSFLRIGDSGRSWISSAKQIKSVRFDRIDAPTTCFETFPFPEPTAGQREAIAAAAKELDELRQRWLNPPEWTREEVLEFPGSTDGPWGRYIDPATVTPNTAASSDQGSLLAPREERAAGGAFDSMSASPESSRPRTNALRLAERGGYLEDSPKPASGIGTVRYPRLVPKDDECAKELKKRTLTNLYNQRPTWLDHAHRKLDEAVFAAYGCPTDLADDQLLERLLALNLKRATQASPK